MLSDDDTKRLAASSDIIVADLATEVLALRKALLAAVAAAREEAARAEKPDRELLLRARVFGVEVTHAEED